MDDNSLRVLGKIEGKLDMVLAEVDDLKTKVMDLQLKQVVSYNEGSNAKENTRRWVEPARTAFISGVVAWLVTHNPVSWLTKVGGP